MKTLLSAGVVVLFAFSIGCDGGGGGTGGNGNAGGSGGEATTGGSGGTGGSTGTGGAMGGMGGAGGAMGGMGGTGGAMSTTGTGGTMTGAGFAEPCTADSDCEMGLVCFEFNAKGMLCTLACTQDADCPAPSTGCNNMGYCKPN